MSLVPERCAERGEHPRNYVLGAYSACGGSPLVVECLARFLAERSNGLSLFPFATYLVAAANFDEHTSNGRKRFAFTVKRVTV